jgi:hypothetical protein
MPQSTVINQKKKFKFAIHYNKHEENRYYYNKVKVSVKSMFEMRRAKILSVNPKTILNIPFAIFVNE